MHCAAAAATAPGALASRCLAQLRRSTFCGGSGLRPLACCVQARRLAAAAAAPPPAAAASSSAAPASTAAAAAGQQPPHVSVLLDEILAFFGDLRVETYVDGTLGAAGHAAALLGAHPELRTLVGFDMDTTAHPIAAARLRAAGAAPLLAVAPQAGGGLAVVPMDAGGAACAAANLAGQQQQQAAAAAFIVHSNFGAMQSMLAQLPGAAAAAGVQVASGGGGGGQEGLMGGVDAILLDLGISSMQVCKRGRGV